MEERVRAHIVECAQLAIRDTEGRLRAAVSTAADGLVGFSLNSPSEAPRLLLTVDELGCPQVDLHDADGQVRAGIRVDNQGVPSVSLMDSKRRRRILVTLLPTSEAEAPAIMLLDGNTSRIEINVPEHGAALIEMNDKKRRRRVAIGALPDGSAGVNMFDANGQVRTEVSIESSGQGNFILYDATGREVYHGGA
jgi:hypothetical protein